MSDLWNSLAANHPQISALSSIAFGFSGLVVAWFAYRLNYRNNWGMKPAVLITSLGGKIEKPDKHFSTFTCEIWNRRKYPITVELVFARMKAVNVAEAHKDTGHFYGEWVLHTDGDFVLRHKKVVKPGKHTSFRGAFPTTDRVGVHFELPKVRVYYFDTMKCRKMVATNAFHNVWSWNRSHWTRRLRQQRFSLTDRFHAFRVKRKIRRILASKQASARPT